MQGFFYQEQTVCVHMFTYMNTCIHAALYILKPFFIDIWSYISFLGGGIFWKIFMWDFFDPKNLGGEDDSQISQFDDSRIIF